MARVRYLENRLFGLPKVQEAYNIINFWYLMENSILKIFGSMDVKITPDFCSKQLTSCCKNYRHIFFREVSWHTNESCDKKSKKLATSAVACSIRPSVSISMEIALQRSSAKVEGSLQSLWLPDFVCLTLEFSLFPVHTSKKADEVRRLQRSKYTNQVSKNSFLLNLKNHPLSEGKSQASKCEAVICFAPWIQLLNLTNIRISTTLNLFLANSRPQLTRPPASHPPASHTLRQA